jgi:hypothetical protein
MFSNSITGQKEMRIIVLGYSNIGKTYYLGSLFRLRIDLGPNCFSIRHKDIISTGKLQDVYDVLSHQKRGSIGTTVTTQDIRLVFQQGVDDLFNLVLTDIVGQSIEPGRNVELGRELLQKIPDYDGILLFLKAPEGEAELEKCKNELAQLMDLSGILLQKKENIPVGLVITQLDKLTRLQGIKEVIDEEVDSAKADIMAEGINDYLLINDKVKALKGEITNKYVRKAMMSQELIEIISIFQRRIEHSKNKIAYRIFPATSFGFDNATTNPNDNQSQISASFPSPYGTTASFLWMIYAIMKLKEKDEQFVSRILKGKKTLANKVLEDISDLYIGGKAFYDNNSSIWNLRNIGDLFNS